MEVKIQSVTFRELREVQRIGVDCHLRSLNQLYPEGFGFKEIWQYLNGQRSRLKPQSLDVLACGFKRSIIDHLGYDATFDDALRGAIDRFFQQFRCRKKNRSIPKYVPIDDLVLFVRKAGVKAGYWAEFLFQSGLRVTEACSIRLTDIRIDNDAAMIRVRQKGGRENEILINAELIFEIRHIFRGSKYLFETQGEKSYRRQDVASIFRSQSERILGYRITPHMLRHSFATYMTTQKPELLRAIMRQGGWSSAEVFLGTYVHQQLKPGDVPRLRITG